ncbi:MAG TPA: hypothetical protein VE891_16010 [Allosphingosinicella sp.]|nr:hypothetical protein [Allosphingosinicella sp.]
MSPKPSYPKDAAVGDTASESGDSSRRNKHLVTGAAIGIGSAAIVAALLYARKRKSDR